MSKHLILALLIASASGFVSKATLPKGTHGVVVPTDCGGVGTLIETRVSDCDALPCRLTATSEIEIDFEASAAGTADLKLTVTPRTGDQISETQPLEPLVPGGTTSLTISNFAEMITSQEVTVKIEVINNANANEICVSALFNEGIVAPPTTTTLPTTTTITTTTTVTPPPTTTTTVAPPSTTTAGATGISVSITVLAVVFLGATQLSKVELNF